MKKTDAIHKNIESIRSDLLGMRIIKKDKKFSIVTYRRKRKILARLLTKLTC